MYGHSGDSLYKYYCLFSEELGSLSLQLFWTYMLRTIMFFPMFFCGDWSGWVFHPKLVALFITLLHPAKRCADMVGLRRFSGSTRTFHRAVCLSPLLYAVYVGELESVDSRDCAILQYADDVCLFSSVSPVKEGLRRLSD